MNATTPRIVWAAALLSAGALGTSACSKGFFGGDEKPERFVRIVLVPEERLNSASELTTLLRRVDLTFDSPEGFAGVSETGEILGALTAVQADADEPLELEIRLTLQDPLTLPAVLLTPGQNGARPIGITARGFDGKDQPVAAGKLEPRVLFSSAQEELISVPLNLTGESLRAPALVGFAPAAIRYGTLGAVAFYLSKPVARESLDGQITLSLLDGSDNESPVAFTLGEGRSCPFGKQMWTLTPSACHSAATGPIRVNIAIAPAVVDERGFGIRDPEGKAGVSFLGPALSIRSFGPCPPDGACAAALPADATVLDLACDSATGLWEPASCSLSTQGCLGTFQEFAWYPATDDAACQAIHPDTGWVSGADQCAVVSPPAFACNAFTDCKEISSDKCQGKLCSPVPCVGALCSNKDWVCTASQGCRPRIGGCQEDCAATLACTGKTP